MSPTWMEYVVTSSGRYAMFATEHHASRKFRLALGPPSHRMRCCSSKATVCTCSLQINSQNPRKWTQHPRNGWKTMAAPCPFCRGRKQSALHGTQVRCLRKSTGPWLCLVICGTQKTPLSSAAFNIFHVQIGLPCARFNEH